MNKLAVTVILIATTLLNTACTDKNYKSDDSSEMASYQLADSINFNIKSKQSMDKEIIDMPVEIVSKNEKIIKHVQVKEESTLQEKTDLIVKTVSEEAFNGLTIKATIYANEVAKIVLREPADSENSRISWKNDYLNEQNREETINTIVKNMLQEQYKGPWIKTVQLYYEDELITLD